MLGPLADSPIVRVVPGGGGAPFSPADLAGLRVWLEADAITGLADGDPIAAWMDASGNGHDFGQSDATKRFIYTLAGINGRPVARSVNPNCSLSGGDLSAAFPTAATLFIVAAPVPTASNYNLFTNLGNDTYWRYSGTGDGYWGAFRATRLDSYPPGVPQTGTHLYALRSGANYEAFLDGASAGARAGDYSAGSLYTLGAGGATPNGANTFDGDIAVLLLYDSALSDADMASVQTYLNSKYAIY